MNRKIIKILTFLLVLIFSSCKSAPAPDNINTIMRSDGAHLGMVRASAAITANRATGETTGDTMKYGYINDTASKSDSPAREKINAAVSPVMEKALANAVYEIIMQVREKGGNAVTNVVSNTQRDYDPETRIETVKVTVTAMAVKADK